MIKQLRIFALALLMAGVMALPAFAGTTSVNHGGAATALTVALEVMGAARTVGIVPSAGANAINYTPAQIVADTNLIEVTLSGATFKAATVYRVCDNTGALVAQATPGAVSGPVNFGISIAAPLGANTPLHLTDQACAATDNTANFILSQTSSATNVTIRFRQLTSAAILLDDSTAVNLAVIAAKYAVTVGNSAHVIDVAVAAGADGTKFTAATGANAAGVLGGTPTVLADSGQGTGAVSPSLRVTITAKDVDEDSNTNGNPAPALTTTVNVIFSGDFAGVSRVFISDGAANCDSTAVPPAAGNRVQSALNPTSPATLTLPSQANGGVDQTTGGGNKDFRACVLVNGTTFLNPRTVSASIDVNVTGAGANDPTASSAAAAQTWTINGADIRVTAVKGGPTGNDTTISINNLGATNGTIRRLEVYRLDAAAGLAAPSCVVTNIPAGTFSLFANAGNTVRASSLITTQCSGQAPFITGASAEAYGVRLVLDIAPGSVGAAATRVFADGRLINLPVQKGGPGANFAFE